MNRFKIVLPISHLFEQSQEALAGFSNMVDAYEIKNARDYDFLDGKEKLFHSSRGIIEHDFISYIDDERLYDYLHKNSIKMFSFDLGPSCEYKQFILPLSKTLAKSEIYKIADKKINYIRKHFSGVLAVENLNYYRTGLFEHICKPEFISDFIKYFDLYFLLDLAHAKVSAHNLKRNLYEYLELLPMERVVEIHISRPFANKYVGVDAHEQPLEDDFQTLWWCLPKAVNGGTAVYIAIEYYKNIEKLMDCYRTLNLHLTAIGDKNIFSEDLICQKI